MHSTLQVAGMTMNIGRLSTLSERLLTDDWRYWYRRYSPGNLCDSRLYRFVFISNGLVSSERTLKVIPPSYGADFSFNFI